MESSITKAIDHGCLPDLQITPPYLAESRMMFPANIARLPQMGQRCFNSPASTRSRVSNALEMWVFSAA